MNGRWQYGPNYIGTFNYLIYKSTTNVCAIQVSLSTFLEEVRVKNSYWRKHSVNQDTYQGLPLRWILANLRQKYEALPN